jgi:hypothetical protein
MGVEGYVTWSVSPVAGARVELRSPWSGIPGDGRLVASATTDARGYFVLSAGAPIDESHYVYFPAQLGYEIKTYNIFPFSLTCRIVFVGNDPPNSLAVFKQITALSLPSCHSFDCQPGTVVTTPRAVSWAQLQGTSYYCVSLLNNASGNWEIPGGDCGNAGGGYKSVGTATSYALPTLRPGRYQFIVTAWAQGVYASAIGDTSTLFTAP